MRRFAVTRDSLGHYAIARESRTKVHRTRRVYDDNVVLARESVSFIHTSPVGELIRPRERSGGRSGADARLGRGCCNEEAKFASPLSTPICSALELWFSGTRPGEEKKEREREREREREGGG